MARQRGSGGWRGSVSARIATVVGAVCVTALVFAIPAFADDQSDTDGHGHHRVSTASDQADESSSSRPDDDSGAGPDNDGGGDSADTDSHQGSDDSDGPRASQDPGDNDSGDRDSGGRDSKRAKKNSDRPVNSNLIDGTPCTKTARACVDLKTQQAWLIDNKGNITRGPVDVSSGGPGEETPVGTFSVAWKDKNHKSKEYKEPNGQPAPMPYSVFFATGGVAFHGGSLRRASAGCVHLDDGDAVVFYNTLKLGDQVQVH
ncbi:MAG TPA: L,D-transpeptidase [Pseudonocardia sp.]|jgi:hypothetical protein